MSNVASVRKEVRMLERVLVPKTEPEWAKNAREIDKALREYERIKKESGFYDLSPREQAEQEMKRAVEAVADLRSQGYWTEAKKECLI
jgi:hypothetical protein